MNFSELILVVALCLVSWGNNSQVKQQELEKQRQDSIQAAERAEQERAERIERISFTTSQGTFNIEEVLDHFYNVGTDQGTRNKNSPRSIYHFAGYGTETKFKDLWVYWYGIPKNEKAKDVYNRALKKYIKGYDDGWNF